MEKKRFDGELEVRIGMCKYVIEVLERDCKGDPRQPDALNHYKMQLAQLESELPEPPDVTIGLKSAVMTATVPK